MSLTWMRSRTYKATPTHATAVHTMGIMGGSPLSESRISRGSILTLPLRVPRFNTRINMGLLTLTDFVITWHTYLSSETPPIWDEYEAKLSSTAWHSVITVLTKYL